MSLAFLRLAYFYLVSFISVPAHSLDEPQLDNVSAWWGRETEQQRDFPWDTGFLIYSLF